MKRSIFSKSFVITSWMFAICFAIFGIVMLLMGRSFLIREKQDSLYANADEVKRYAEAYRLQGGLSGWELRMSLTMISQCTGNHIFLCNPDGVVLTSSDIAFISPYIGIRMDDEVITRLRTDGSFETLSTLGGFYDTVHYIIAEPIASRSGKTVGYVFVSYESDGFLSTWSSFTFIFILIAAGILALTIFFSYFAAERLSRPLKEMAVAARRFGRGDYSARVTSFAGENEISTLTNAFNVMADSIEKNESDRREFIANVSHELRTPMTSISGFADGILDGTIPPEEERRYLETISSESKRLSRLVSSMLDMSRLRDGDPAKRQETFDLSEMILRTLLTFEEAITAKHLNVNLDMPEDPFRAKGDVDALTRVVYNLIDNAVKFSENGTDLSVSLWKEGDRAYTCVQDEGTVIPPEELPRIFDRFHKADHSRSQDRDGVGLGLYMVREILSAHDQDIFVTSQDGVTAFTFTLSLAESE